MTLCPACHQPCPTSVRYCPSCGVRLDGALGSYGVRQTQPPPGLPGSTGGPAVPMSGDAMPAGGTLLPLAPGTLLNGRYRIESVLGAGSFGRVYRAEDTQDPTGPRLAIKELLDTQFATPDEKREAISWFKREVSTLLTLEHHSIPAIHGYWTARTTAGPFYLAMEYIPGKTLDDVLQEAGGPLPWPLVVSWGITLCEVLSYLHGRTPPFVFRDLKLPNVMLDERTNQPVLIDFGIARQLAPAGGTAIGTWGYVPYEQILGNAEPRSDLYALGATLHALLSGQRPDTEYRRLTRGGLDVASAMRALFPPLDTLAPEAPGDLSRILARATAFGVDDRFPDAAAMTAALQQVAGGSIPIARPRTTAPPSAPAPTVVVAPPSPHLAPMTPAMPAPLPAPSPPPPTVIAAPARPPRTLPPLIVARDRTGQYRGINAAIQAARPGTRIEVRPGLYDEAIVLDRHVELIAAGPVESVILEGSAGSCLTMQTDYAVVRGFTICGRARRANQKAYAVDISRGQRVLEDCHITSDSWACVLITGAGTNPLITRCTIHDGSDAGLYFWDESQGVVQECDIYGHADAGIAVERKSTPTIRSCAIHNNEKMGVEVSNDGLGTLVDIDIYGNGEAGIAIASQGNPRIERCVIHANRMAGICATNGGLAEIENCDVRVNAGEGVWIADGGGITIRKCRVVSNGRYAIHVDTGGAAVVEDCDLRGNMDGPWLIAPLCPVERSGNI